MAASLKCKSFSFYRKCWCFSSEGCIICLFHRFTT